MILFFCFFPYLDLLHLPTDTQPNALIFSLPVFFFLIHKKIPTYYLISFLLFIVAGLIFISSDFEFGSFLSFSNYFSVLVVPVTVFFVLKTINGLSYKFFSNCVYVWGVVGLIQKFLYPNFLNFLLSRSSDILESTGRGVVGLAPEPTYYGSIVILFFIIYLLNFYRKRDYFLIFILFIQLFVFAISTTAILVLGISVLIFLMLFLVRIKFKFFIYFIAILFLLIGTFSIIMSYYSGSRFYKLATIVISSPELVFFDQSISERFNAIYFSIGSLFENYGFPYGYNYYKIYMIAKSQLPENSLFFLNFQENNYNRILSGFGMGIFELGVFGLLIPVLIFYSIRKILNSYSIIFAYILFNILLFTAMSLNNSMLLFVIGNLMYLSYRFDSNVCK
jgi:hypothetical protein